MMNNQPTVPISFHYLEPVTLKNRTALRQFIKDLFRKENKRVEDLTYIFCSDDYLLDINQQFLQHDYYTDIITFDLSQQPKLITGEIYISIDRVRDNARQFKTSINRELHRVIFHGALHLCGYKDKTAREEAIMRKMEDKYLNMYL